MMGVSLPFQFSFQYSDILAALLSTILLIYGGKPFFEGAIAELKQKAPGMMALVSLGLSVSLFIQCLRRHYPLHQPYARDGFLLRIRITRLNHVTRSLDRNESSR